MYICVDFDGTIVDNRFPMIGQEAPKALYFLRKFQEIDAKIILFTMRSDDPFDMNSKVLGRKVLSEAVAYVKAGGIKLYGINENPTQKAWTSSPKAYGNIYIDDAAFGCPLIYPEGFNKPCVDWQIVGTGILSILYSGGESK